jgi:hypothetical protein
MPNLLVLLVLLMTTFLSSLFSPASGLQLYSFVGFYGFNQTRVAPDDPTGVPPGGVLEVPRTSLPFTFNICINESLDMDCFRSPVNHLPEGARLISTNLDVASVEGTVITLKSFGSTTLRLRQNGKTLASYILVVFDPINPGRRCVGPETTDALVDCAHRCVSLADILGDPFAQPPKPSLLNDGICDDGTRLGPGRTSPIDLSCIFFIDNSFNGRFNGSLHDEDCTPEQSCTVQFGAAPDFQFCDTLISDSVCFFNATTGKDTPTGLGTCKAMCEQFNSQCRAALNNNPDNPPGCTPRPNSRDTCETPRQTEICGCARR